MTNCVTVHSEDVVDTTAPVGEQILSAVLTQLNTFMHASKDVCFGQKWSATIWRGPTASPRVLLPQAALETEADKQTSLTLHSSGAASRFGK